MVLLLVPLVPLTRPTEHVMTLFLLRPRQTISRHLLRTFRSPQTRGYSGTRMHEYNAKACTLRLNIRFAEEFVCLHAQVADTFLRWTHACRNMFFTANRRVDVLKACMVSPDRVRYNCGNGPRYRRLVVYVNASSTQRTDTCDVAQTL